MQRPNSLLAFSLIVLTILSTVACAPRPDPAKATEMARVFGECTLRINARALNLPVISADDPRQRMIEKIVDELIASRYLQFPWKVKTILFENPLPNAFTTGGGFLAAFSGVYAMTDDEAAMAGVIAHELAHMAKTDPLELANYLEFMLATSLQQSGVEGAYTPGTAVKTVTDFCLAIPGLVSVNWKQDLVTTANNNAHPTLNDQATPYVPFTFSQNPQSPYYHQTRDPEGKAQDSSCNNAARETHEEFVVINPDYYLATYPNAGSLPPIPDGIGGGSGGIPGAGALWQLNPWVQFQHTAFARYVECQSDEAGVINLLASGYNPLALNQSFTRVLDLFGNDEAESDWRFQNHPSLGQRIEDIQRFITHNDDIMPPLADLQAPDAPYLHYKVLNDQLAAFETARDNARAAILNPVAASTGAKLKNLQHFAPITVADIAVLLSKELARQTTTDSTSTSRRDARCQAFAKVYQTLTGEAVSRCLPVEEAPLIEFQWREPSSAIPSLSL